MRSICYGGCGSAANDFQDVGYLPPNLSMGDLTSKAHVCRHDALTAMAVLPAPKSTELMFVPISARQEQEQESELAGKARKIKSEDTVGWRLRRSG